MPPSGRPSATPAAEEDIYGVSPAPPVRRALKNNVRQQPEKQTRASPPSPAASTSSDKENMASRGASNKGKGRADMPPPKLPTPLLSSEGDRNGKRRRQTEPDPNPRRPQRPRPSLEADDSVENEEDSTKFYDPDQNLEERRQVRKGLRDLAAELNENRAEYLNPGSTGLFDTLTRANELFVNVKQTADATIDSRLLVTTADLSYRQTLSLGDSAQGVDLDEFVSKCITFMRSGGDVEDIPQTQHSSTQGNSRRRRSRNADYDEDGEEDDGDQLNWARLGRLACLPYNSRPSVPGFLLGPLSFEKKARKPVQRTARLKVSEYTQTQPVTLKLGDIDQDEHKTLIYLTKMIHQKLLQSRKERCARIEKAKQRNPNMSSSELKQAMESNGLLYPKMGLNLWQFVINPRSFGQTVENIFYVSFLIRDGKARLGPDDDGQLGLFPEEPGSHEEQRGKNSTKYQGIISIDMADWTTLIELYNIKESMIDHRDDDEVADVRTSGWVS